MSIFRKVIDKYGWQNIKHEIVINGLTKSEADEHEQKWILHYKNLGISYNVSNGGDGCSRKMSDETKAKISAAHKGKKRGPHSAEWNANISKHRKGVQYSPEALKNLREARKRRIGAKMPKDVVERIAKLMTGRIWINNGQKCKMCTPEQFESYIEIGWKKGRIVHKKD